MKYAWGDCRDQASLKEAVKGVDQVFHSAGVTKAVRKETFFEINASGTEKLIQACLEHNPGLQKFIYVSSQAAAGPSPNGNRKKETDPCEPVSPYGQSKRMGEELALSPWPRSSRFSSSGPPRSTAQGTEISTVFFKFLSRGINLCASGIRTSTSASVTSRMWFRRSCLPRKPRHRGAKSSSSRTARTIRSKRSGMPLPKPWGCRPSGSVSRNGLIWESPLFQSMSLRFRKKPSLINRGKVEEMVQTNWVCDITKARTVLGFDPGTPLAKRSPINGGLVSKRKLVVDKTRWRMDVFEKCSKINEIDRRIEGKRGLFLSSEESTPPRTQKSPSAGNG